ncbi:stanniocalcin-2a isoform X2 [Synchiropus splendidus]|uniref:stanniocalcin-2a isoform X2 n=1 Tax=Synchiropus splendidus TaxID=270530 RepID=UPI00237E19F5|nr:stanniocalcin-2a isoform X2 [Synchiropus splendidus]
MIVEFAFDHGFGCIVKVKWELWADTPPKPWKWMSAPLIGCDAPTGNTCLTPSSKLTPGTVGNIGSIPPRSRAQSHRCPRKTPSLSPLSLSHTHSVDLCWEARRTAGDAMWAKVAVALLVLSVWEPVECSDTGDAVHDSSPPEKPGGQKGRLSLHNTAEIQHCLVTAGDVGCGVFECFENNSCEIRGLQEICMTFLHNAGKFDSQGKSFIKDALKCMAHGLRHKFSCISRKCVSVKEMVFQLQRECYMRHNLCSAAKENVAVMVDMIHFQNLFPKGPYVELVNILLSCGEEVKEALTRSVRLQCEQNWGALCDSLSLCSSMTPSLSGSPPDHRQRPVSPNPNPEPEQPRPPRHSEKEKHGKAGFNSHPRNRSQGLRRQVPEAGAVAEQENAESTDIRRGR